MPESVLSPAPVSTTVRPPSSSNAASATCVAHLVPAPRLGGLDLAILGWSGRGQALEQPAGGRLDLGHGVVEGVLVGLGRSGRPTDLADVLHGCGVHLVPGRGWLEVVEGADVAAHADEITPRLVGARPTPELDDRPTTGRRRSVPGRPPVRRGRPRGGALGLPTR